MKIYIQSDNELIFEIQKYQLNDKRRAEKSFEEIINRYKPLILSMKTSIKNIYWNVPYDDGDIQNIITMEIWTLCLKYNETFNMSVPSYLKQFLYYGMVTHFRKMTNEKNRYFNQAIELNENNIDETITNDEPIIIKEEFEYFMQELLVGKTSLKYSETEKELYRLRLDGKSFEEIAKILNKAVDNVYVIWHRLKEKLAKEIALSKDLK